MQIVVIADGITQKEFQDKRIPVGVRVQFFTSAKEAKKDADAYFYLLEEKDLVEDTELIEGLRSIVFVHAVSITLKNLPANCIRICGWRGFLLQNTIEICAGDKNIDLGKQVLQDLEWDFNQVPDILGMLAPRTTAILINEAYLIVGAQHVPKQQIDDAMKRAANFGSGPFELADKIGLQKIFNLLEHLELEDKRYSPASLLKKEILGLGSNT